MTSPYSNLSSKAFWRKAVAEGTPFELPELYLPKLTITPETKIATAGSCFAQHITRHLRQAHYNVLDLEKPPYSLGQEHHQAYGFSLYSCRYGNIYTAQQLLQLALEAKGRFTPKEVAWEKGGRYVDALRPGVEPEGLTSVQEVQEHRRYHLSRVKLMFKRMDLFIFTLGLTEAWTRRDGMGTTVYPTAPGTIAGSLDASPYQFHNYSSAEVLGAMQKFVRVVASIRRGKPFQMLLTVSPVPLTATASGEHVLAATTYSKASLRAAAGDLASSSEAIDYFPSFEIITNPAARGMFYEANLRSVRQQGVEVAMRTFLQAHQAHGTSAEPGSTDRPRTSSPSRRRRQGLSAERAKNQGRTSTDLQCEEALLEAFGE